MTRTILTCAATALIALPTFAEEKTAQSSSSSVITNADGTATITIDVNGKKETKTFKLGDGGGATIHLESKDGELSAVPGKREKITFIGIAPGPVSEEIRAQLPLKPGEGIKVNHVAEDSPAGKAGIQEHDILLRMDEQILVEPEQLRTLVKMKKPGDEVKLSILRKGEQKEVKVVLSETEEHRAGRPFNKRFGNFEDMQNKIEEMKGKLPGSIFQRKGIIIGADGKSHTFEGGNLEGIVEMTRKQLEGAGLGKDEIEKILKSVKEATKDFNVPKDPDGKGTKGDEKKAPAEEAAK